MCLYYIYIVTKNQVLLHILLIFVQKKTEHMLSFYDIFMIS